MAAQAPFAWPRKQAGLYNVRIRIGGDLGATVELSQCDPINPEMLTEAMKLVALALGASVPKPTAAASAPVVPLNGTRTSITASNPELDQLLDARRKAMWISAPGSAAAPVPPPPTLAEKEA